MPQKKDRFSAAERSDPCFHVLPCPRSVCGAERHHLRSSQHVGMLGRRFEVSHWKPHGVSHMLFPLRSFPPLSFPAKRMTPLTKLRDSPRGSSKGLCKHQGLLLPGCSRPTQGAGLLRFGEAVSSKRVASILFGGLGEAHFLVLKTFSWGNIGQSYFGTDMRSSVQQLAVRTVHSRPRVTVVFFPSWQYIRLGLKIGGFQRFASDDRSTIISPWNRMRHDSRCIWPL